MWWSLILEYLRAVARHVYLLLVGVVGAALSVVSIFAPTAVRIVGLVLLAIGVVGAQFLAWVEMRRKRNQAVFDLELIRDSVHYRLRLAEIQTTISVDNLNLAGIQIGLVLENASDVVLEYEMESMIVVLGGRTASSPVFNTRGGTIAPGGTDVFFYPAIQGVAVSPDPAGEVEFNILYGIAGETPRFRWHWKLGLELQREIGVERPNRVARVPLMPESHERLSEDPAPDAS
jgi:hypothetical protein